MNATSSTSDASIDAGTTELQQWYGRKLSTLMLTAVNGASLLLAMLAVSALMVSRIKNKKLFDRTSLKIILALTLAIALFHASYLFSLYKDDVVNCKISTFLMVFGSLLECFLISSLAINLVLITFSSHGGPAPITAFSMLFSLSFILAVGFSASLILLVPVKYYDIYGCWFVEHFNTIKWVCYFGPIFFTSIVNAILATGIYIKLKRHVKALESLKSTVPSCLVTIPVLDDEPLLDAFHTCSIGPAPTLQKGFMDRSKPNLKGSKNEEKPVNSRSRSSVPSCPDLKDTSHQNVRKSVSFLGLNENPSQAGMKNAASPSLQHIYEENSDEDHEYGALRRDTLEKEASDGLHPMKRKTRQHVISQSINAKDHVEDLKDSSPNVSGLQSLRWKRQDSSRSPSHTEQQKSEAVFKSV